MTILDFVKINEKKSNFYAKKYIPECDNNYEHVGHGRITNAICGSTKDIYTDSEGSEFHMNHKSCLHLHCPVCSRSATYNRSKRILTRLWGISQHRNENLYHLVISPKIQVNKLLFTQMLILNNPTEFMKQVIYPILKKHTNGGLIMYHEHRLHWVHKKNATTGNVISRNIRYLSPHFHCIVGNTTQWATDVDGGNMLKKYKMIFSTKENKKTGSYTLDTVDDIQAVAYYQLSHASYKKGTIAYRYIGKYANCKFKVQNPEYHTEIKLSEKYGLPLREVEQYEILEFHYNAKCLKMINYHAYLGAGLGKKKTKHWIHQIKAGALRQNKIIDSIRVIKLATEVFAYKETLLSVEILEPPNIDIFKYININIISNN